MLAALLVAALSACATHGPPVTKIVGGRRIATRSVDPSAYEHASRALLYEEQERWAEAAAELRRALAFDGDSPELHARLAEVLLRLGQLKEAASEVRKSLAIGVSPSGLLASARLKRAQGDLAGTLAALERARGEVDFQAADDAAEVVYLELAETQVQLLDVAAAQATLEALCSAEPASGAGHMRLMAVYWAQGEMDKAVAELRAALGQEPNQIDALAALAWIAAASGKNDEARRAFRDALDRSEASLDIAAAFARFLVGIGSSKEAEQLADDLAVPDNGLDAETLTARVALERSARRLDRALALLARAQETGIAGTEKNRLALLQAPLLKEKGKPDEALAILLKVGKDSPLFFEARLRAAELLRESGKTAEASRTLEEAAATAKGERGAIDLEAAIGLALIDEKRGDPQAGVARLEEILARNPGSPHDSRGLLTLASIDERRGSWQPALARVEGYLAKNPGSVEALNFWGFVAADHNHRLDLATKRIVAANVLDPGSGGLIDSLAWVYFRRKDLDKAGLFVEQAARLEPGDAEIQWHLGEICAEKGDSVRAAAAFRRALAADPDHRLRRKVEASLARLQAGKGKDK